MSKKHVGKLLGAKMVPSGYADPNIAVQMVITTYKSGITTVKGPLFNKALCDAMLGEAEQFIKDFRNDDSVSPVPPPTLIHMGMKND